MRPLLFSLALAALPAHADLYRWVDPQSGSVKFSNLPPPWYGDPRRQAGSPAVEVISYQAPGKPPAAVADKPAAPRPLASLEERWRAMLQLVTALPGRADFDRAGQGVQQQVQAYEAVRAEEGGIFERLKKGLEAQIGR